VLEQVDILPLEPVLFLLAAVPVPVPVLVVLAAVPVPVLVVVLLHVPSVELVLLLSFSVLYCSVLI
jgi:hypothetical protein